jgi:transglutaminase-like putative cysteine protease
MPHPLPDETDWYGVYQGRDKVGWAMVACHLEGEGEDAKYLSRTRIEARLTGLGQTIDFSLVATDVFRGVPPFDLLRAREKRVDGGGEKYIEVWHEPASGYMAMCRVGNENEILYLGWFDYTLEDRLSHIHWVMGGPKEGTKLRVREFDLSELRSDVFGYDVKSVGMRPAYGMDVVVYDVPMRSQSRGKIGSALIDTEGRVLVSPLADVAEMRLEPRKQARERRFASELFAFGRAPATESIPDPRRVRRLVAGVYGRGADRFVSGPRQDVRRDDHGDVLMVLGEGADAPVEATEDEIEEALATTERYAVEDPRIVALAKKAVGHATDPNDQVDELVHFVSEYIEDVNMSEGLTLDRLFDERLGDATEHAWLFVMLARSLGIPAREVRGLLYAEGESPAFVGHAWCEVVLDDVWRPVDPTLGQARTDATHVTFARNSDAWVTMLAVTRRLTFEIREVWRGR